MEAVRVIDNSDTTERYTFAKLVDVYGGPVYKFCRSITFSKEIADDLFQETFLKVLEQMPKIDAHENPQSFLISTAAYIWKGWKRKYARRSRLAPAEPLDEFVAVENSMENDVLEREEANDVRKLVDALPEKLKTPIILYYTLEMSVPDIALTLKIPDGTVKSRLYKARKMIEKGLTQYGES